MELNKNEIQEAIDEEIKTAEKLYGKGVKLCVLRIIGLLKMLPSESAEKQDRLIPLSQWSKYHPYPTVGALRQYRHYNTDNFNEVLEYGGIECGKLLIRESKLFEWLERRGKSRKPATQ